MSKECIFCRIAKGEIPAEKVMETEDFVAFRDINPIAPTHVLIIPREHIPTLNDLGKEKAHLANGLINAAQEVAKKSGIAKDGYRIIINCNRAAGQEIFHLHAHVIGGRQLQGMG
ncbi:MAG: histidine triad nucleotide-binding protein [Pseudomonadota bacterium]